MKPPAFQFYPDDFLSGTVTMSHEERGFYILLLCVQWSKGGVTEDDFSRLGRTVVEPSLNHVRTKFQLGSDGLWKNQRLEEERGKQAAFRESQAEKGRASAKARFNRGSIVVQPNGVPKANSPISDLRSPVQKRESSESYEKLKLGLIEFLKRDPSDPLNYAEESSLFDVSRRKNCLDELKAIVNFRNATPEKDRQFIPKSLESICLKWNSTLDRARNFKEPNCL